jgi:dolichyl-diphosphooligosaccharide--protein glycosyltransferase/undecaprenyl-diphosphooligosaccharide--protein glycosyltransferase
MILIFIAYTVSIAVRLIWVYQFGGNDSFIWEGQLMINTNDGYYFAESARDILNGTTAYTPDINGALAIITVFFAKIFPFSFETIILYMPAFLGSLLVVPIVLIGHSLNRPYLGFIAGLFAAIVWSY